MGKFLDIKLRKERERLNGFSGSFNHKINTQKPFKKKKPKINKQRYHKYLLSEKWRVFRELALEFYGRVCGKCGGRFNLQVHHKNYINIFNESFADVMILCKVCHRNEHKNLIWENGKKSRYMRDPKYNTDPVTYFPTKSKMGPLNSDKSKTPPLFPEQAVRVEPLPSQP